MIEEVDAKTKPKPGPGVGPGPGPGPGVGPSSGGFGPPPGTGGRPAKPLTVIILKHATAVEMVEVLKRVFPTAEITPDQRSNQLIIRADDKTMDELEALVNRLDVEVPKRK
jgi:hypothetical protein